MKPEPKKTQVYTATHIDIDTRKKLIDRANKEDRPISSIVRLAIEEYLNKPES